MSEEQAFLHAIAEDPADDAHRLVFADWLEDHGQPARAAFLRAQLRAASLPEDDPDRDAAEDEADDLLTEHEKDWLGDMREWALEWDWRRGGIEHVTVRGETVIERGEELFAQAPIRSLRLLAHPAEMARLAESGLLQRIESLDLSKWPHTESAFPGIWHRDRSLMVLLGLPQLTRLTDLKLAGQGIEGLLIQTLISTHLLGRLVRLDLSNNGALGDRAIRTLATTKAEHLEYLNVGGTNLLPTGIRDLLNARGLAQLRDLEFGDISVLFPSGMTSETIQRESGRLARLTSVNAARNRLNWMNLIALLRALPPKQLTRLSLTNLLFDIGKLEQITACPNLAGLRNLCLVGLDLRDREAQALAGSPFFGQLASLDLSRNRIGGPGIRALMQAPTLARLQELNLWANYVGNVGVETITATDRPRRLKKLVLNACNLDETSARTLAGSPALSRLRVLHLAQNRLGDDGVKALAGSSHLRRLRELYLDDNGIDSPGAQALLDSPYLRRLVRLSMRNAQLTDGECAQLRARFGEGTKF
jgi:uncharacterized protein (TIGR02996 family)